MHSIVGFLAFPGLEELDLVGPWEIIRLWSKESGGPTQCLIVGEKLGPIECAKGLTILPDCDIATCPELTYLVVPGGIGTRREVDNNDLVSFISRQGTHCRAILSVCTGALLLQKAGLLNGRRATTHWRSLERLRGCENVTVVEERLVRD
jgi:transcriptional regulator GlxA family with amidase domain